MGLENEKSDARIFMNEDDFNRAAAPMLHPREKGKESPDRDPHGLNSSLQIGFEDVIAEPSTTHSLDKVWICSHALFEVSKYLIYKLLTVLLAIPLAFLAGLVFAVLTCVHIWIVMPFIKTCLMVLPSVQAIWKNTTDAFITPVFISIGKAFLLVRVRLEKD